MKNFFRAILTSLLLVSAAAFGQSAQQSAVSYGPSGLPAYLGACALASAATVDLGTCPNGALVTISGTTTITSLGSSAPAGSAYILTFTGSTSITTAAATLPFNSNLATNSSGTFVRCQDSAAGTWFCSLLQNNNATPTSTGFSAANVGVSGSTAVSSGIYRGQGTNLTLSGNTGIDYRTAGNSATCATNCGTTGLVVNGNGAIGSVVFGTGAASGAVLTFGITWPAIPVCVIEYSGAWVTPAKSISATAITLTGTPGTGFTYICGDKL